MLKSNNKLIVLLATVFITVCLGSSCKSSPKTPSKKRIVEVTKKSKSKYTRRNKRRSAKKDFGVKSGDAKLLERGRKARFASSLDAW
jgi:hypothetical protein